VVDSRPHAPEHHAQQDGDGQQVEGGEAQKRSCTLALVLLSGTISADPSDVTPLWSDDLSGRTLEEVLRAETENRAWSKTLRQRATALVNSRLSKAISPEDYAMGRQQANADAAECKRREAILDHEIHRRGC
jgi:hypothetical protein